MEQNYITVALCRYQHLDCHGLETCMGGKSAPNPTRPCRYCFYPYPSPSMFLLVLFLLVLAYPGCPGQTAVKWLLLLSIPIQFSCIADLFPQ